MAQKPKTKSQKAVSRKTTSNKTIKPRVNKLDAIRTQLKTPTPITDLTKLTGWQPHSVRAALTRLRQRGSTIERTSIDGVTHYRVKR